MRQQDPTYSVSDLRLAALLRIQGFKLLRVQRGTDGRGVFVFEDRPNREELVLSFLNREQRVEPIGYTEEQRNLKGVCRDN